MSSTKGTGSAGNAGTSKERRERAAAAVAAQKAAEKRRATLIKVVSGLVIVAVVAAVAIVAIVVKGGSSSTPVVPTDVALPKGVQSSTLGVPVGTAGADKPELAIWEDFQCPVCRDLEKANGAGIVDLANSGQVRLLWRPAIFLDDNLNNDSSLRATAAWGCAIDADKAEQYHSTVFANQPAEEGDGYTDAQLLQFGKDVGITGAAYTTFEGCVAAKTYQPWAQASQALWTSEGVPGTPAGYLNGGEIPNSVLADQTQLEAAIAAATNQG